MEPQGGTLGADLDRAHPGSRAGSKAMETMDEQKNCSTIVNPTNYRFDDTTIRRHTETQQSQPEAVLGFASEAVVFGRIKLARDIVGIFYTAAVRVLEYEFVSFTAAIILVIASTVHTTRSVFLTRCVLILRMIFTVISGSREEREGHAGRYLRAGSPCRP